MSEARGEKRLGVVVEEVKCAVPACQNMAQVTDLGVDVWQRANRMLAKRGERPLKLSQTALCSACYPRWQQWRRDEEERAYQKERADMDAWLQVALAEGEETAGRMYATRLRDAFWRERALARLAAAKVKSGPKSKKDGAY